MFIRFRRLAYKNFLSVGNAFVEIDLSESIKTLVVGKNGAAKSSILDALYFALYGRAFRNINRGKLVNSINKREMLVELSFDIGSYNFKVVRGISPDRFEIYQDGELIEQYASVRDYQKQFEKNILQMNRRTFSQIVVLGSANYTPFMMLGPQDRREVIEDMLELKIFAAMNTILKDQVQQNKIDVSTSQAKLNALRRTLKTQQDLMDRSTANRDEEIAALEAQILELKRQGKDRVNALNELNDRFGIIGVDAAKESELIHSQQEIRTERTRLGYNHTRLEKEIEFFKANDVCPTCSQSITPEFSEKAIKDRELSVADIDKLLVKTEEEQKHLADQLEEIKADRTQRSNAQMEMNSIRAELNSLKWKIQEYESQTKKLAAPVVHQELQSTVESIQQEIGDTQGDLEGQLELSEIHNMAATLLKDGGIKARIIAQYIPLLNTLINKYLTALDFFVQFEIDENFNEHIRSRYRDDFEYNSFSQGEKLRIDIAMLFAWRELAKMRNSVQTNLLLMDEVMDGSIDADGAEEFMKLLDKLSNQSHVIIISHRGDAIADKFDRVLKFEKHGNYSTVTVQ